jgi:hypothetical protein
MPHKLTFAASFLGVKSASYILLSHRMARIARASTATAAVAARPQPTVRSRWDAAGSRAVARPDQPLVPDGSGARRRRVSMTLAAASR